MAKRNVKKKAPTPEEDAKAFFDALNDIEAERGISKQYMLEKIEAALISAYKSATKHDQQAAKAAGAGDEERGKDAAAPAKEAPSNVSVIFDEAHSAIRMVVRREVVETVTDPDTEISLEDVRRTLPYAQFGDTVKKEIKIRNFGRVAAQTARQVIIQGIREAERSMVYDAFASKTQEMMSGIITRIDPRSSGVFIRLTSGKESIDALLSAKDQAPGEVYKEGNRIRVYVTEVRLATRGAQVSVSRTHYGLVRRLFELEVPELFDGTVEIKSIAREAGSRTKMAVWSNDPEIDPIGTCVGKQGARVNAIVDELNGEKVDIIKYSEDMGEYIAAALAPATVISVSCVGEKSYRVVVPDDKLSLAIGKDGQNARLAARLTGCKIDIKSATAAEAEDPAPAEGGAAEELIAPEEELILDEE